MKFSFIFLFLLVSCGGIKFRRVLPFESQNKNGRLEIFFSESENDQVNFAVVKARITNQSRDEIKLDLKKSYQLSAWYRWQRFPRTTSETPLIIPAGETRSISLTFMRREFGILHIPFSVNDEVDEFITKFDYCSPWEKCP